MPDCPHRQCPVPTIPQSGTEHTPTRPVSESVCIEMRPRPMYITHLCLAFRTTHRVDIRRSWTRTQMRLHSSAPRAGTGRCPAYTQTSRDEHPPPADRRTRQGICTHIRAPSKPPAAPRRVRQSLPDSDRSHARRPICTYLSIQVRSVARAQSNANATCLACFTSQVVTIEATYRRAPD